ncbi:MAG: anaerobic ribonucleoside-triphosphate reductase activating protein [Alphaproteobacteria bacterium]|nr:anaerobic ribonucleoside-triphosphate reductase activating protein [Alphaproteobacteria bacterium]
MKLPICDVTPFTLQDFPEHTACILWFGGCNMRCAYCHNPELVTGKKARLPWEDVWQFLEERRNLLDGVVISGGECTLSPELPEFIRRVRELGYKVKLDTNGLRPDKLEMLLLRGHLDYVALDYKAPREKFIEVTGGDGFTEFHSSLVMLCRSAVPFEVRTTVHTGLLDEHDVTAIMDDLQKSGFRGSFYVQNFRAAPEMMRPLPEQPRRLDLSLLPTPQGFTLHTRNF